jgi:hypothetical protein
MVKPSCGICAASAQPLRRQLPVLAEDNRELVRLFDRDLAAARRQELEVRLVDLIVCKPLRWSEVDDIAAPDPLHHSEPLAGGDIDDEQRLVTGLSSSRFLDRTYFERYSDESFSAMSVNASCSWLPSLAAL